LKKAVTIQVNGKQQYLEGHEDWQELSTSGIFYERNGDFYVVYQESELTGLEGVTTFLSVQGGLVVLNRQGSVDLLQKFKKGVLNHSVYTTSFGRLCLSVLPRKVEYDLTVHGGRINLEYDLFVDDNLISYNALLVNIKEDLPQ